MEKVTDGNTVTGGLCVSRVAGDGGGRMYPCLHVGLGCLHSCMLCKSVLSCWICVRL